MADVASEDNAEYLGEIFCVNLDTLNIGVIELLWTPICSAVLGTGLQGCMGTHLALTIVKK